MFTNVTEWEKAGAPLPKWEWTYQKEWLAAVQQVHASMNKGADKKRFGYQFEYVAQNALLFIRSWGGDWIDPANRSKAVVTSPESVAALAFMRDLLYKYKVSPTQPETVEQMFINGLVGSWSQGNWNFGTLAKTVGDKFKWRSFGMPAGPAGRGTFVGVDLFAINSRSKKVDAAWEFGKYMVFDKGAALRAIPGALPPPAIKKFWDDPIFNDPNWEDQRKWMDVATGWTVPANARVAEFNNVFSAGLQAILNEANDFMTEVNKLQKALQDVLNKPSA